jgi:hypothetical protein
MRLGLLALFAAGCSFHASFDGTHYKCGAGDSCPSGQACVAGECVIASTFDAPPGTPDTPPGTPDAPVTNPDAPVGVARCGTVALLRDGFDNGLLPIWDEWNDNGPSANVANSRLTVSLPSGSGDLWAGLSSHYLYDLTGSRVEVQVSQVGGVDTVVEVRGVAGGKMQMVVENGVLNAFVQAPGTSGSSPAHVTYDPAQHKRWRIREDSGTSYWEWSPDGVTWTELWHQADPFSPADVEIQLSAGGLLSSASEARFENVNINVTAPAGYCGASTLVDAFAGSSFGPQWISWNDNHTTIGMSAGNVVITTDGSPVPSKGYWAGFQTSHLFSLASDSIYLDATNLPQQSPFVSWMQMIEPNDDSNRLELNVEGNTLYLLQVVNGSNVSNKSTTYDPVAMRYWRLRADASNFYFETSPDATTWTTKMTTTQQIDPTTMQLVIGGGQYDNGATVSAQTEKIGGVNTK